MDTLPRRPDGVVRAVDGIDLHDRARRGPGRWSASPARARPRPGGSSSSSPARRPAQITFDGEDVSTCGGPRRCATYRRRVQLIFQDPYETLNPKQTIHDFVAEPLEVNGLGAAARGPRGARRSAPGSRPACRRTSRSATRTSSPAASASASSSPGRWSWARSWSWPTSRSRCSTSRSGPSCCG